MDIAEFAENIFGIKLMEYQKQFLRECYTKGPNVYITIPPSMGRINYEPLWLLANALYPNKKELTQNGPKTTD